MVEKISKDTKESKKLRTRTKVLIVVIGVLLVLMAGYFTVFAGLKYDISDSSHIKNMELIGNNIEVKLEIPSNWTNKEVWEDITLDGADTFVDFTICYGYGKTQKGDDTVQLYRQCFFSSDGYSVLRLLDCYCAICQPDNG